jgi:hypothetical protein
VEDRKSNYFFVIDALSSAYILLLGSLANLLWNNNILYFANSLYIGQDLLKLIDISIGLVRFFLPSVVQIKYHEYYL